MEVVRTIVPMCAMLRRSLSSEAAASLATALTRAAPATSSFFSWKTRRRPAARRRARARVRGSRARTEWLCPPRRSPRCSPRSSWRVPGRAPGAPARRRRHQPGQLGGDACHPGSSPPMARGNIARHRHRYAPARLRAGRRRRRQDGRLHEGKGEGLHRSRQADGPRGEVAALESGRQYRPPANRALRRRPTIRTPSRPRRSPRPCRRGRA